jgi:signal transduction histidine kinase/FixJ family two-component response regulator
MIKKLFKRLYDEMMQVAKEAEPYFCNYGIVIIIAYLGFYFFNCLFIDNGNSELYENLRLRLSIAGLGVLLALKRWWPYFIQRLAPYIWYLGLIYTLPFFFVFMFLNNSDNVAWNINIVLMLVVLFIFVQGWLYLVLLGLGTAIGVGAFYIFSHGMSMPHNILNLVFSYTLITTYYVLFSTKRDQVEKAKAEAKRLQSVAIAYQVAHDIRSPLVTLELAAKNLAQLPESQRLMIRKSIQRIHDIANSLVIKYRQSNIDKSETSAEIVPLIAETILSEKRIQFSGTGIDFKIEVEPGVKMVVANIEPMAFQCMISNILNNSVESIKSGSGWVNIRIYQDQNAVILEIIDTGIGIAPEIIGKLFQKGASYGKKGGSGLGLWHAKECIEKWGGFITINSQIGNGTKVTIRLPQASSPVWLLEKLWLEEKTTVVIVDDDASIHDVWAEKFRQIYGRDYAMQSFRDPETFMIWYEREKPKDILCLIDYEFIRSQYTGLDLMDKLKLDTKRSFLVTSHYDDSYIRALCVEKKIKMIPKNLVSDLPTGFAKDLPQMVIIDDNQEMINACVFYADTRGKKVAEFTEVGMFLEALKEYPKNIPIYLDSDLGYKLSGELIAKDLYDEGYTDLNLMTGFAHQSHKDFPWLKNIFEKNHIVFNRIIDGLSR